MVIGTVNKKEKLLHCYKMGEEEKWVNCNKMGKCCMLHVNYNQIDN